MIPTPHPLIKLPTRGQMEALMKAEGPEAVEAILNQRESAIELSKSDPLRHGFQFPSWPFMFQQIAKWMEAFAFGGNGASKSIVGAYVVAMCLEKNPGCKMYCFAQDEDASKQIQQRYIWEYLPQELRYNHKTETGGYIKYTTKNGFTDSSFILDMRDGLENRECHFYTYSQYQANKHKFEGYEYGSRNAQWMVEVDGEMLPINVGAWLDEYLENGELYNTLLYRIPRRGASIFTTFTAIDGMTPFVADKIKGSEIKKTIKTDSDLFDHSTDDKGNVKEPLEVEWVREKRNSDIDPRAGVGMVFFPSKHNPWAGYRNMLTIHRHKSLEERLVRFHGIPSNVITTLFPMFSMGANVVKSEDFPDISDKSKFTTWHIDDHAAARNHFNIWGAVDANGSIWIRREWPDRKSYGEWAIFGDPKWKAGPATKKIGYDVQGYADLYADIERDLGIEPFERVGDSRAFANENDDNVDRFTQYAEVGLDYVPSDGRTESIGMQHLDDWFAYNPARPIDIENRPLLNIHEDCGNLIDSLLNYQMLGTKDEALKDPVDCLRYFRMVCCGEGPQHYDSKSLTQKAQGGAY